MFWKKTYTLYAIQYRNKQGVCSLIGLYKDENKAKRFCDFLNEFSIREDGIYEIHYITTDLN